MKNGFKKYFIPSEENENKPYSLRDKSLRNILISAILLELIVVVLLLPVFSGKLDFLSAVLPSILVAETNQERQVNNLNTLKVNDLLVSAAQLKANDMAEKGYFAHTTPEGKQPWYFVNEAGYQYEHAGENLAVNFVDSKKVHDAWMQSPTHKANILKESYTEIGIATARGQYKGQEAIFVVQFFGKPKLVVERIESPAVITNQIISNESDLALDQVAGVSIDQNQPEFNEQKPAVLAQSDVEISDTDLDPNKEDFIAFSRTDAEDFDNKVVGSVTISNTKQDFLTRIISSPITSITLIITALLLLITLAIILNIFIKIKVQYPKIILNSILVLVVLLLFYILNTYLVDLFGEVA